MHLHALKQYRSRSPGFPDLLNWGAVVDDGIVLNKDGSLMAGYFYRGQDLAAVPPAVVNQICGVVNAAFVRLGGEWMLHQDALRVKSRNYPKPEDNAFPNPVTTVIEQERRMQFGQEGAYYESVYACVLTYLPPFIVQELVAGFFFTGGPKQSNVLIADKIIAQFKAALSEFEGRLSSVVDLERMKGHSVADDGSDYIQDEFLQYLHGTLSGEGHPVILPACPMYLDYLISGHDFHFGIVPRMAMMANEHSVQINSQFVDVLELWLTKDEHNRVFWSPTLHLNQKYFDSLQKHAVPLDERALAALAHSAMALDIYAWLAQRLHRSSRGQLLRGSSGRISGG